MNDIDTKSPTSIEDIAQQVAETIQKEANVRAVFGEPQTIDTKTVIPVAKVTVNGGAGGGGASAGGEQKRRFVPLGGGGGLSIEVTPLGFICEKGDEVVFNSLEPEGGSVLEKVEHIVQSALQRKQQ
jgi:uncharacterized spore protein YtfJ